MGKVFPMPGNEPFFVLRSTVRKHKERGDMLNCDAPRAIRLHTRYCLQLLVWKGLATPQAILKVARVTGMSYMKLTRACDMMQRAVDERRAMPMVLNTAIIEWARRNG